MGTNYYWQLNEHTPKRHIGKSSYGWAFQLHVHFEIPDVEWYNLGYKYPCHVIKYRDWKKLFEYPGSIITSEYNERIGSQRMREIIEDRAQFIASARTELSRTPVDGVHCVYKAKGSWDYIAGEFS